jgi:integrase
MSTRARPTPLPTSPAQSLSLLRSAATKSAPPQGPRGPTNLTIKLLAAMRPGDLIRDAGCRGMYAECGRRGDVSIKVAVDIERGKTVRKVIGHYPELDLTEARALATRIKADVQAGKVDPRPRAGAAAAVVAAGPVVLSVGAAIDAYVRGMQRRERDPATIKATEARLRTHLASWLARDITKISNTDCQRMHDAITDSAGKGAANCVLRNFRTVRRHAIRKSDNPRAFDPSCPVASVDMHPETPRNDLAIALADLPSWWRRVEAIPNPARVILLKFGLLSGLRPHNVAGCRREWVDFDAPGGAVIRFPARAMKTRQPHTLPLSAPMVALLRRAFELGELVAHDGGGWVFPTIGRGGAGGGRAVPTKNWHQPGFGAHETGHGLRRTYRMLAAGAGVAASDAEMLLGHSLPKVQRAYFDPGHAAVQGHLRACQERVSRFILEACGADPNAPL